MPRIRREFKTIHVRSDKDGNQLIVKEEPVYGNRKIYVHLNVEQYPRFIGEIDRQNRILIVRRQRNKHLHRDMNSYGFNYTVIHDTKQFSQVMLEETNGEEFTRYLIPVKDIISHSVVKFFKQEGLEVQYFMRLEIIQRYISKQRFRQNKLCASPVRTKQQSNHGDEYDS